MSRLIPGIYILVLLAIAGIMAFERMSKLILGIHILVLLAVAVVLAVVLEFFLRPLGASGEETRDQKLDRRVLRRLAVVGGEIALVVLAATITGYLVDPHRTWLAVAWLINHPASLLPAGVALYLVALLCGVKPRQPVLLFCLTLPGLVIMPLLVLPTSVRWNFVAEDVLLVSFVFVLQPGVWILLLIGFGQALLLHQPVGKFNLGGLVRLFLISIAYVYGFIS
jgi:hypothetical protein